MAKCFVLGTDLTNILVRGGVCAVQTVGIPDAEVVDALDADLLVVALKSRTPPVAEGNTVSVRALRWLQGQGRQQFFFNYCPTFDSTAEGTIGPVAEEPLGELGSDFTIAYPAFPEAGRPVFRGHLFVQDASLNESGMEHNLLTPMRDPNLIAETISPGRWMGCGGGR